MEGMERKYHLPNEGSLVFPTVKSMLPNLEKKEVAIPGGFVSLQQMWQQI